MISACTCQTIPRDMAECISTLGKVCKCAVYVLEKVFTTKT
uniref:Uncharacterized protein n=1 Tax=Anguilla anguilla TaxID=7936 RepID=A0A0E9T492_ANGAN